MNINERLLGFRPPRIAMLLAIIAVVFNQVSAIAVFPAFPAAGVLTALLGFAIMLRAWWLFKQKETAICPTGKATVLISHDVYALTRNPMYLGIIMMLTGLALLVGTLPFYLVVAIYFVIINCVFCSYEEHILEELFGKNFVTYQHNVRRWL